MDAVNADRVAVNGDDAANAAVIGADGGAHENAAAEDADAHADANEEGGAPENGPAGVVVDDVAPGDGGNADVGILDADASSGEDDDGRPSDLLDVYEALGSATLTGSFASSDIADGNTLTPALPNPGLNIVGVGDIPLPLGDVNATAIKSSRHTAKIQDGAYHKVHSVEGRRLRIKNPAWEGKFASLLQTVAYRLGVDPDKLSTELDALLLMEKGSQVKRGANAVEEDNVIGTLLVQLPSTFKGGKVTVYNVDGEDGEDELEDEMKTFDMGVTSGEASFSCHFSCHYKDCEFQVGKVTSGHRALLRYSLRYGGESEVPTANALISSLSALKWSLRDLPPSERILLIPLAKQYKTMYLGRDGINALSHKHRSRLEAIKVSAGEDWRVLIVNAKLNHVHKTVTDDYYGDGGVETISSSRDFSVLHIFDEEGNMVTTEEGWLKSVIKFTPLDVESGMILNANEEAYKESWGRSCSSSTKTSGYYEDTKTTASKYISSFILAYDATLVDAELKCLRGSDGVAEVANKVVDARDYPMLERMLAVVDSKTDAKLDVSSCKKVLRMLNKSRGKSATSSERIEFVQKTLSGLDSNEPDTELYNAIRAAACKFGYENIKAQIADLIGDEDRMKGLKLHQFLLRCDFILKLSNGGHGIDLLKNQCQHLPRFGANKIEDSSVINSTIDSLMSEHGREVVATVVEATLRFLHSKTASNRTVPALLDRARLLNKMSGHPYGFVQSCLVDFAKDFAECLSYGGDHVANPHLRGENRQTFVKAICYVMEHGSENDLTNLGAWSIKGQDLFPLVLEVIVEQQDALGFEARGVIHEMLNRCLVQHSCCSYGWRRHKGPDGKVPPSIHVRKIIADYPNMTRTPGRDGRLTLHCASANAKTPFDTIIDVFESFPEAASIRCPVSGIYPFMLASSNCPPPPRDGVRALGGRRARADMDRCTEMIGASFRLLLADPSLVAGGIPADDEESRKRKRSASLDGQ